MQQQVDYLPRLVVIGGFLGAGKTTLVERLGEYWSGRGQRVAVVTNDQAGGLVDTARLAGAFPTREVTGGCFCCRLEDLETQLDALVASAKPDVILAEPVGSCTDLVATVMRPLAARARQIRLAPYVALLDPHRFLRVAGAGKSRSTLSQRITYLFRMQLLEAPVIAVNKADTLGPVEREAVLREAGRVFPRAEIFVVSARTGEGIAELGQRLERDDAPSHAIPIVDYGIYGAAEAELAWLNAEAELAATREIDAATVLDRLVSSLSAAFDSLSVRPEHAKLRLQAGANVAQISMVGHDCLRAEPQASPMRCTTGRLLVNVRTAADPMELHAVWTRTFEQWIEDEALEVLSASGTCFRPGQPVPSSRLLAESDVEAPTTGL